MFEKMKLKKKIKILKEQIVALENKRSRSQAALVSAILNSKDADERDVEFFNKYTAEIDKTREELFDAEKILASL